MKTIEPRGWDLKYRVYLLTEFLGLMSFSIACIFVIVVALPFWAPFCLLVWFFDKEEKRAKGIK